MKLKVNWVWLSIALFAILVILLCVLMSYKTNAFDGATAATNAKWSRERVAVLKHAASSVDSEQQFGESTQWKGQPSKCFSCEKEMASRCGDKAVYNATKQKLFSG
jgi:hypothetical protein